MKQPLDIDSSVSVHWTGPRAEEPPELAEDLTQRAGIKKILVIRWSAMGDVVIASAGFESLSRAFPNAELHLNTLPPWDVLFEADPRFTKINSIAVRDNKQPLKRAKQWLREVIAQQYDLIVDFQCSDRVRALLALLRLSGRAPRYLVGNAPMFPYRLAPVRIPEPVHALTRIERTLMTIGVPLAVDAPVLYPTDQDRNAAALKLQEHGLRANRYAVFLPRSQLAGYLKRWGAERFARLARELFANQEQFASLERIVLLGGPDEIDECKRIADLAGARVVNLCNKTSLLELLPICEPAAFVVANDTGTAHLASAAKRPMVVICGPTDPRMVLPAGSTVRALQANLSCINCYQKHCDHHSCMREITPYHILDLIRTSLTARCAAD